MKKLSPSKRLKLKSKKKDADFQGAMLEALNSHTQMLTNLSARVVCLEELCLEKNPEITPEILEDRIELITDRGEGLIHTEIVVRGDKVRVKVAPDTEGAPVSKILIRDIGSGNSLPTEIEESIIGMRKGASKTIAFPGVGAGELTFKVVGIATIPVPVEIPKEVPNEKN